MVERIRLGAIFCLVLFPAAAMTQSLPVASKTQKPVSRSGSIVVIGASYAKSWNLAELQGSRVINKGVGGEQTHEILARFDRDVVALEPRAVILWGFINDIFRSTPEELVKKLVRTRENIRTMTERAVRHGIVPILVTEVTMPPPSDLTDRIVGWYGALRGRQSYREYVNTHVMETNRWMRQLASERNIMLLEFERLLANKDGYRRAEYASRDGTHLSLEAYEAMTRYVQSLNHKI